jgi:hypothetical protein
MYNLYKKEWKFQEKNCQFAKIGTDTCIFSLDILKLIQGVFFCSLFFLLITFAEFSVLQKKEKYAA